MQLIPPALERLIQSFAALPGIGKKTATRLALHVLRRPTGEAQELSTALAQLHGSINLCSGCFAFSEHDPCDICGDSRRSAELVCVVEQPSDLIAIENTGVYRGHYHILHGVLSPIDGIGPDEIKFRELMQRTRTGVVKEILIATSSTVPGEATASYLLDKLQNTKVKITRLAYGIPMGMDIKYADKYTLARAIEGRGVVL